MIIQAKDIIPYIHRVVRTDGTFEVLAVDQRHRGRVSVHCTGNVVLIFSDKDMVEVETPSPPSNGGTRAMEASRPVLTLVAEAA